LIEDLDKKKAAGDKESFTLRVGKDNPLCHGKELKKHQTKKFLQGNANYIVRPLQRMGSQQNQETG